MDRGDDSVKRTALSLLPIKAARSLLLPLALGLVVALLLTACTERAEEVNMWEVALGDAGAGEEAIEEYGCPACHVIPGIPGADGQVGPPLTDWSERQTIAGALPNIPPNLIRWVMEPQAIEPDTLMPDMGVSERDARDIAAYLYTLGDGLTTASGPVLEQPVAFSHQVHAGGLGIDCRYCHDSVEESAFAGMPSTHTCMTCHSQVWTESPLLAPVRISWEYDVPIPWVRIHDLAESTHFNHAAHLSAGVGCEHCHGQVEEMQVTHAAESFTMEWCLECHRDPAPYLQPRETVFDPLYERPPDQRAQGEELIRENEIPLDILTDCSLCHY
ncbi:MAG: hypothetical protein R3272_09300 [Candidatus Promineifilaceae bacterium]|nr:hypothetical protein [Candidatus Promineifilaceae bacterium]